MIPIKRSEPVAISQPEKEVRFGMDKEVYFRPDDWVLESPQETHLGRITESRIRRLSDTSTADSYTTREFQMQAEAMPKSILKKSSKPKASKMCCVIS